MNVMKRVLSLLLALVLLLGNIPAAAFAEETEIPAETEIVAAEETLAPTEAVTEPAEETAAPTEAATEPTTEETAAPTEAATEPAEETVPATEEAAQETESDDERPEMVWQTIVPDVDLPENEELHTAYIEQVLYGNRGSVLGIAAGERLSGDAKVIYDALVPYMKEIASGERASTAVAVGQTVTDSSGYTYIPDVEAVFTETDVTEEAVGQTVSSVIKALLSDLPFEMYWYDKLAACSYGYMYSDTLLYVQFAFPVADNYMAAANTVNTAKTSAAAEAVRSAENIVSKYAASSDYEKLIGYRDAICKLVSYNHTAADAGNYSENDDPWQLVYVFDGDPDTNVVCEGYSKAFMYLCDMTDFAGNVSCYTVSGAMAGGGHMWNIVTLDGSNYMVDVTNSDSGTIGQNGGLFLVGGTGSAAAGYTFLDIDYTYDSGTQSLWGTGADSILTLAAQDYEPNAGGDPDVDENIIASGTCGDNLTWVLDDEGTLTISGSGAMPDYAYSNYSPWYEYRETIKAVVIESGVTGIGYHAFRNCSNLTSVEIPDSVTGIGNSAFDTCSSLTSITIPASVTSIGTSPFYRCSSLKGIWVSDANSAYYSDRSGVLLSKDTATLVQAPGAISGSYEVPHGVTMIGAYAFAFCDDLTNVVISDSVTSIEFQGFNACSNLTSVTIGNGVTSIANRAFDTCSSLTSIVIPASVTSIGTWAFHGCSDLTSITFKGDVPSIRSEAFTDVSATAYYPKDNATWTADKLQNYDGTITWTPVGGEPDVDENIVASGTCGDNLTWKLDDEGTLTISGSGAMNDYDLYFDLAPWDSDLYDIKAVIIEDGVTTIGKGAFYECGSLTSVTIGSAVADICDYAFYACDSLTDITIPDNVTSIGTSAFHDCESLKNATIGNGVTTIGSSAFRSCDSLKSVTIGDGVTSIGNYVFYYCDSLSGIWVSEDNNSYCSDASGVLFNKDKTVLIQAPGAISGDYEIPNTVTSIGRSSFASCGNLTSIVIPDSVTDIGEYTFSICGKLKSVTIGNGVTVISQSVFNACDSLMNVTIPDSVTTIGNSAFYSCDSLANITIPGSVTSMGTYAFGFCAGLTEIAFEGDAPEIAGNAFKNVTATAYYPADNATWTTDVMQDYNGTITWEPYGGEEEPELPVITGDSFVVDFNGAEYLEYIFTPAEDGNYLFYFETWGGLGFSVCKNGNDEWIECGSWENPESGDRGISTYLLAGVEYRITVHDKYGEGLNETIYVTKAVPYDSIWIETEDSVCYVDNKVYLKLRGTPEFALERAEWTVSDPSVLEIYNSDATNLHMYSLAPGTVTVTVTTETGKTATIEVTVLDAPPSGSCGENVTWILENGTLTISGNGATEDYTASANAPWYDYRTEITTIIIESGVCGIGSYAFHNCNSAASVVIPDGVIGISRYTFLGCESLTEINLPATVTAIDKGAFWGCKGFTDITIPASVEAIGMEVFGSCKNLTTVTFEGDAPEFVKPEGYEEQSIFGDLAIVAYYPAGNPTWTVDVMQNYGGNITWEPYGGEDENIVASGTCGDNLTWVLDTEGTLIISGTGKMEDYEPSVNAPWYDYCAEIAAIVIEDGVTNIGSYAFRGCNSAASIVIPDGVTSIGRYAFLGCENLTEINLPVTVTGIDEGAFWGCRGLTGFVIPDGVTVISDNMFEECSSLISIVIPDSVNTIGNSAFSCCRALTDIQIPDRVGGLGAGVFFGCSSLVSIEVPFVTASMFQSCYNLRSVKIRESSVTSIGDYAFADCENLVDITLPENLTAIGDSAFHRCWSLPNVEIPDTVTSIGAGAFVVCWGFTDITIPANVKTIGVDAFGSCKNLKTVIFEGDAPKIALSDEFDAQTVFGEQAIIAYYPADKSGWTEETLQQYGTWVIGIPYNVEGDVIASGTHGENLSWVLDRKGTLTISGNGPMENYDDWTCYRWYYYYGMVENVVIEEGVTTLGDWCFGNMRMKSVKLPESLTSIGVGTFWDCMPLENINIPEGVTSIGAEAFLHCLGLTSITIPAGVTKIDGYAFANCSNLKKITFEGDAPVFGDGAFFGEMAATAYYPADNATWTEEVMAACGSTITWKGYTPDGTIASGICGDSLTWTLDKNGLLTIFGMGMMPDYEYPNRAPWDEYREEIKSIVIKDGVTNISARAFSDLTCLTNIEIPDSVTDIGEGAFNDCWSLSGIVIPDSVTSIGDRAFYFCRRLENVSIGKGVTTIGFDVFDWCSSLSSITIPSGVVSIGDVAFNCCHNLKEIIFEGDAPVFVTAGEESEPCHFSEVTATVYYPANNPTWTADVMQNYGGTITWVAYTPGEGGEPQVLSKPVVKAESNPVTGGGMLSWEAVPEADYYEVYRATSKSGKYKLLETVEGTELEVKVSVGKTYYYKVKAICEADSDLNSSYSSVVKVTGKCAQPEINVTAKPSSGKPVVKWSKVSSAKKYDIYRATEIDGTYKKVKTTTSTSYNDTSAKVGTTYYYKVKAVASKSTYNSAYSEIESCLTILAQPDAELSINKTTGKPVIEWEKVSGAAGYEILRAEAEKGEYINLANQSELTFKDTTAEPDKDYWYKVNAIAEDPALNSIDVTGHQQTVHSTLAQPKVTFGINSITGKPVLTWEEVDGAVEYKIYRSSKSTKSYKAVETTTELSYTDTSVKAGKGYYYKVIAIGENCKSAYSSYKKLTAKCAQPEITAIGVDPVSGKPAVKWNKVSGAEKYYVYRATSLDGTYKKVKTTTSTSYTDTSAKVGTPYYYKVKAVASKSTYNSIYSEVESCLTVLARPVVTAKNDANTGKVILTWEKVSGAVAYEVYRVGEDGILCLMCTQWELTFTDEGEGTGVDTVYTYTVKAIAEDTELNSAESAAVTISAACEKPKASIELSSKKPSISWDSVEGATKYYVYRSTKKSSGYKKVATVDLEDGTSYRDSKAKKGTTYYYKIVAVSENAKSAYSNTVKIKSK